MENIMTNPSALKGGMDWKTFTGCYTAIHNFCTAEPVTSSSSVSHNRGRAWLLGEDLYALIIKYLKIHLQCVRARSKEHAGEALLEFYSEEWSRYTQAAFQINHLFRYLNRHWVKREMDEGKKNIYDIYTLHLVLWKEEIVAGT